MTKRKVVLSRSPIPPFHFWLCVVGSFVTIVLYRIVFSYPVWFDELIAKAVIFGLPVWAYAVVSKLKPDFFGFSPRYFWPGAFSGLAIGGIFAFIAMIAGSLGKENIFIPYVFSSTAFWYEFFLAFVTAMWESLFFYGLVLSVLITYYKEEWKALLITSLIFIAFHAPVLFLYSGAASLAPLFLLFFFALGQGIVYLRTKSIATVVVSHAFWGMALLVYGGR